MKSKEYWEEKLGLEKHPEGGFFKETYRSESKVSLDGFSSKRNLSTGIFFLLDGDNFSAFHRIKSDEMWHFYDGSSLIVHMIDEFGNYESQRIGRDIEKGDKLQFVVPARVWFASEVADHKGYSLVGCTVSPGFDFEDFELADESLATIFPQHRKIIEQLSR